MTEETQLLRSTPVLWTGDYATARNFYRDQLGFALLEEGGEPPRFGIFERGRAVVYLNGWQGAPNRALRSVEARPALGWGWDAYIHAAGLEPLLEEFETAGVEIARPITLTAYGMREFEVFDPDENVICFGEEIEP